MRYTAIYIYISSSSSSSSSDWEEDGSVFSFTGVAEALTRLDVAVDTDEADEVEDFDPEEYEERVLL